MNSVERDIRGYFGIAPEDSILEHYGTKCHSGRYPWGSGENPYQRSGDFLSRVEELKKSGMKEKDILQTINDSLPEEYKMGATEFRMAQRRAIHERQQLKYDRARALSQDGLGPTEIGREMGLSESTVRSMLKNDKPDKYTRTKEIAETLRKEVDKKGMIDVSEGTNLVLGVSEGDLDDAIFVLEAEHGYQRYGVGIRQPTNINQQTNITVLAKPEYDQKYAYQHQNEIQSLGEYHSEDGGETFKKLQRPSSMSSDRVCIRYGDEGGLDKDGVMAGGTVICSDGRLASYAAIAIGCQEYYTSPFDSASTEGGLIQYTIVVLNGKEARCSYVWDKSRARKVTASKNGITFGPGGYYDTKKLDKWIWPWTDVTYGAKFNAHNQCCVPVVVYGFL